jgi:EAL domain-containing protein (putative c-di-GMP-specific phosphodiesterase class I)
MQTIFAENFSPVGCGECLNVSQLGFDFTMAFQPIVDLELKRAYAFEALVRGTAGESAKTILSKVNDENRYRFDQACRVKAIELASALGLPDYADCKLSINFLPGAIYRPETCIRATLEACKYFDFPADRLMFEVTEGERIVDTNHLIGIFKEYRRQGFTTAIDDFGSGYSGLNLLATFQPQILKLDMELTRHIDQDPVRQAIVAGVLLTAYRLNITIIAEGIETVAEQNILQAMGVRYFQGYLYAKPEIGCLPEVTFLN